MFDFGNNNSRGSQINSTAFTSPIFFLSCCINRPKNLGCLCQKILAISFHFYSERNCENKGLSSTKKQRSMIYYWTFPPQWTGNRVETNRFWDKISLVRFQKTWKKKINSQKPAATIILSSLLMIGALNINIK